MTGRASAIQPTPPSTPGPLVLVIEDEAPIRTFLRATLTAHNYRLIEAAAAGEGLLLASQQPPDIVILDLGLPDFDGLEVTRRLRTWLTAPIIVLSARGQEQDKINALDAGAEDYLTKPFGVGELLARMRVALRHGTKTGMASQPDAVYQSTADGRTLILDTAARTVRITDTSTASEAIDPRLTPLEYNLLAFLARHAGKVVTHKQALIAVWGPAHAADVQYLRVYAGELRKKLERDPAQPRFLLTEPGVGYRLREPG
ncbi:MAG: response regulator [Phycisphaerales bacterium]